MYLVAEHQQQCRRSLHPVSIFLISCFYRASLWLRQFRWGDHRLERFVLFMESNNLEKTTNKSGASRFYARRIVRIYDVVERFLRKPFWFFLRILSISGSIRLSSLALDILFLLLTSLTVCHTIRDYLSSTEFLILLIRPWMYWLFLVFISSFCVSLSFLALE